MMRSGSLGSEPREYFSRRVVNGVEILERESVQKIRIEGGHFETLRRRVPRLIVSETVSAAKNLLSKTRSDIAGLDKFLRTAVRPS